jgi:hypothetical protein
MSEPTNSPVRERQLKSISASIIVIAGIACIYTANQFPRMDSSGTFVLFVGAVISGVGLFGWLRTLREP